MGFRFNQGDRPLPGYTIQRGVGRGGFGEVYYATSDGGKEVALKYLRENPQIELRGVTHCLNLKSPYLVALHDVKENNDGDFFVIMEYVSGPSLRDLMNAEPKGLGVQKAAYFLREMGKGLAYLHDRGIVHRDLKPGNIFYEDGYVKIGDYGLAKIMAASQHSGQTVSVGTVHYMAPEVGSGNYDRTIDIYSLGVILYEMLLGRVPFTGQTMGEVLMKHLTAQPAVDELPEPFPRVIRKALAKDPRDRYQTVNEMVAEVMAIEDLNRSVAAFEPASLSTVAARAAEHGRLAAAVAVPAGGGGGGGPLGTGSSSIGPDIPPPPMVTPPPVAGRPVGRFDRLQDRFGVRLDRLADRIDHSRVGEQVNAAVQRRTHWAERLTVGLLVSGGIAFGVGLGRNGDLAFAMAIFGCMLAMVTGSLFGCWLALEHWRIQGKWLPRVVIAAASGVLLLGVAALEGQYHHEWPRLPTDESWVGVLALSLLLCDWPGRYREGRRGRVNLGSAFSAGLFSFVAAILLTHGQESLALAAIAAAASLTLQSWAGIWPLPEAVPGSFAAQPPTPDEGGLLASPVRAKARCDGAVPPIIEPAARRFDAAQPSRVAGAEGRPGIVRGDGDRLMPLSGLQAPLRSPVTRTLWLLLSALLLCGAVMTFASTGLVRGMSPDDRSVCIVAGVVTSVYFLFAFSRVPRRRKSGLWRGLLRPAVFFTGVAAAAGAGTSWGVFNLHGDAELAALATILIGAIVSLFVWFVPVAPYVPVVPCAPVAARPDDVERTARACRGTRLLWASGVLLVVTLSMLAVLASAVPSSEQDEVIPATIVPMLLTSVMLFVAGLILRRQPRKPPIPNLTLPLRMAFEIDANSNLSRLIERHFTMHGFSLASRSDLLWCFVRGSWAYQFWQKDIHHWGTKLNVAAYELDTGGYRLTCFLDVDSTFNKPAQPMIAMLQEELFELKALLGGRDIVARTEEARA